VAGRNSWTLDDRSRLEAALTSSFAGTGQPGDTPILFDGIAVGTVIPTAKAGLYLTAADSSDNASETEQAAAYAQAIQVVGCGSNVAGILLRRLVDGPEPGEQSGLFYADGTPKASVAIASKTFQAAARGTFPTCSGVGATPAATAAPAPAPTVVGPAAPTVVFPDALSRASAPSVRLGCTRACLYLVTLDRRDGKPVLARRGALAGKAGASTVRLPKIPLPAGSYTLTVRLVSQANPGPVEILTGPALPVT
jgi:hypothetical protein